jgi:hypothetical protein
MMTIMKNVVETEGKQEDDMQAEKEEKLEKITIIATT